ncbi:tetratricopeptide repeat protein [Streptomyces sp. URMC 128]|uniref:tetratricopeptide repeat protein n=1 Tax=Streptomyces sp. URMC 128 TaxID=3423404 RepID=UPI003F1999E6
MPLTGPSAPPSRYWRRQAGDVAGAVAAYEQLLTDRERVLGPDHPRTRGEGSARRCGRVRCRVLPGTHRAMRGRQRAV